MRTKKILSILLAMIMCMGSFGVISVVAEEPEVVFGPGAQGWNGVVNIAEDVSAAGGVDSAVILWEAFLGSTNKLPSDNDSFITLYNQATKGADVRWEAYRVLRDGDESKVESEKITIYDKRPDAINTSGSYLEISQYADRTDVKLVITQVAGRERYTWVRVQLFVKVGAAAEVASAAIWVQLRDPGPLARKLLEANKELAKTDRYTDAFLANLRTVTREAEKDVNKKISQADLDAWVAALDKALNAQRPDGTSVGKKYKLTGWAWLDGLFSDNFLRVIWSIRDAFVPVIDFLGQVGKAIGFLLPLFGILGSLLGL